MIKLERLDEPAILRERGSEWTTAFVAEREAKPGLRPASKRYAHREVKESLRAMSHGKCFYCETRLGEHEETVDHYVGVADDPTRAFVWANLYLCCNGCQQKLTSIPLSSTLDPCAADEDPAAHLVFDDEVIRPRSESPRGRATIQRYKLDRPDLDLRRRQQLGRVHKLVIALYKRHGLAWPEAERERIRSYAAPEAAYSLMFCGALASLLPEESA